MTTPPKITPRENGPLVVSNAPDLTGPDGGTIETKDVAALCRCGRSGNKPFCDGSHNEPVFDTDKEPARLRNSAIDYAGTADGIEVTVSYTPVLCTHAAECQRRAGAAFKPREKPWIQPGNDSLAHVLEAVAACPSGALRVEIGQTGQRHMTTGDVGIRVEKDGPYHVTNIALEAEFNGVGASRTKYSLCRCGLSRNKPFCDGTHYDAKWSDEG